LVMSNVFPSEYLPLAANCFVLPTGMLGLAGVTDMEFRVYSYIRPKLACPLTAPAQDAGVVEYETCALLPVTVPVTVNVELGPVNVNWLPDTVPVNFPWGLSTTHKHPGQTRRFPVT